MNANTDRRRAVGRTLSRPRSVSRRAAVGPMLGLLIVLAALAWPASGMASTGPRQAAPPPPPPPPLRVFIDSPVFDPASLAGSRPYVALVPDPASAQVLVKLTVEHVEGREHYLLSVTGQGEFTGLRDALPYVPEVGTGPEDVRKDLAQMLELALMRYVARSPLSGRVRLSLMDRVSPTAVIDPWNFWVFSLSATAFLNGEESYASQMWFGSFSAVRVTPDWKVRLAVNGTYEKDHYDYQDFVYDSSMNSETVRGLVVKSLDDHWSAGVNGTVRASSFSNIKLSFAFAPAVEFDVFPYSESTKRQLRLLYKVGIERVSYVDETIYGRRSETLFQQTLSATLELNRSWGTASVTLEGANYLHDMSFYHVELNSDVSLRVFKGLSLSLDGGASWIHDQLSLASAGATLEDIILQRRELATSYDVFVMVGLNYSFGSVLSKVVNPRFGSPGGGGYSVRISN